MKNYSISALLICFSIILSAQDMFDSFSISDETLTKDTEWTSRTLTMNDCPYIVGFEISTCTKDKIDQFLADNIVYPDLAIEYGIEETCQVLFEVGKSGDVDKVVVRQCEEEIFGPAIKKALVKMNFDPEYQNGLPVNRIVTVYTEFILR